MCIWLCSCAPSVPCRRHFYFQIIGHQGHKLQLLPPIDEFSLVFYWIWETLGVSTVYIQKDFTELGKFKWGQLCHLMVPYNFKVHMFSRCRKYRARQSQWVDLDELRLLDCEVSEEFGIPSHIEWGWAAYRYWFNAFLLEDHVTFKEATMR